MLSPLTLDSVHFHGFDGVECEEFIMAIRSYARSKDQGIDDTWIAKEASACFCGDALRWHISLEDDVRDNWRLLERALVGRYPAPTDRELNSSASTAPTPPVAPQSAISRTSHQSPFSFIPTAKVGSFNINDVSGRNKSHLLNSIAVSLDGRFVAPPSIPIGLSALDIHKDFNIRIAAHASKITKNSFTPQINTRDDSILYGAECNWLVLSPGALEYDHGVFCSTEDHPKSERKAQTSRRINFKRQFSTPPNVICFLNDLDMDKKFNWRIKTYVSGIDAKGFTLHIDTWSDTILYAATAGWIAYPEDRPFVISGTADVEEIRHWNRPQLKQQKRVEFIGTAFNSTPEVFIALNSLDIRNNAHLRLRCYADDVTPEGFTWHIDSWSDTTLYRAGVSYLCVG